MQKSTSKHKNFVENHTPIIKTHFNLYYTITKIVCQVCSKEFLSAHINAKYCSSVCYRKAYRKTKSPKLPRGFTCYGCKTVFESKTTRKYCTKECKETNKIVCVNNLRNYGTENPTLRQIKDRCNNTFRFHATIREQSRRLYKYSERPKLCERCGYDKYYEVCHIKPIKEFTLEATLNEINDLDNLIALCPNCHKELDMKLITIDDIRNRNASNCTMTYS